MKNELRKLIREIIELDINIGDEILAGKFRNKKVIVKDIGKDEKNQPTINGKTILKFRIKKLIQEELNKLFEVIGFNAASTEQIATNMALFKLPRKGMDDFINNYNQIQCYLDENPDDEDKEKELDDEFEFPSINGPSATVSTNIFEEKKESKKKKIEKESYGIYGSTQAAQDNLDRVVTPSPANFGDDAQAEFDMHNDNINRSLKEKPAGNSREGGLSNNKTTPF